jgi:hypothetical protein
MKKMLTITALIAACLTTASAADIHAREVRQQKRIAQGVRTGNLTRHEAATLENKERAIHREIRRDRLDGPGLTLKERRKITRQQNRMSRKIYQQSHDNQVR